LDCKRGVEYGKKKSKGGPRKKERVKTDAPGARLTANQKRREKRCCRKRAVASIPSPVGIGGGRKVW